MRNKPVIKLFLVLFLCTAYLISFSRFGPLAFAKVSGANEKNENHTMIGSLDVTGLDQNEARKLLEEKISAFLDQAVIKFKYREAEKELDLDFVTYDVDQTFESLKENRVNTLYVTVKNIDFVLAQQFPMIDVSSIDIDKLEDRLVSVASNLEGMETTIDLGEFLLNDQPELEVVQQASLNIADSKEDLSVLIGKKIMLDPQSQFSFLSYIKAEGLVLSDDSLSMLATAIYETMMPTNFAFIERHISTLLPSYAKLGSEVRINGEKEYDFVMANPNNESYTITLDMINNTLIVQLLGEKFANTYDIVLEDEQTFKPKIIPQFSPQLALGEKKVTKQGIEGKYIKVVRQVYDEKGLLLSKETLSEDYYAPVHQIEVHSLSLKSETTDSTTSTDEEQTTQDEETDTQSSSSNNDESATQTSDATAEPSDSSETAK